MARHCFDCGQAIIGRLSQMSRRPLENSNVALLRLEFEVFSLISTAGANGDDRKELKSTGKIVCRDIVVGPKVDPTSDSGLWQYFAALKIENPERPDSWMNIPPRTRWVKIELGDIDPTDMRNRFAAIHAFDPTGYEITEYDYDLDKEWVTPLEAANRLKTSANTVRRRVKQFEPEHGSNLVRLTDGGHRRIRLVLLRNLMGRRVQRPKGDEA